MIDPQPSASRWNALNAAQRRGLTHVLDRMATPSLQRIGRVLARSALAAMLGGCGLVTPKEITEMQARTTAGAEKIAKADPTAFKTYTVGSRTVGYVEVGHERGDRPLVIFIHGSPGGWTAFTDYLADRELSAKARLISVDRPGFGRSGSGLVERSLPQQAKALAPLLDTVKPGQRVVLVGHSYGGPLAARMAMDYGEKITDIVMLAGSIDPALEETAWYQYPADWFVFSWMIPTELVVTNREIRALKTELEDMLPLWGRITQRVSIMQGELDDLVPAANADFAQRVLTKTASLNMVRMKGANHFIPWNRYDDVKAEIIKHLE